MRLTDKQRAQLLKPIAPSRVMKDGKGHPHVSQQDVTAHLIRVFGFGSFDIDVISVECVFEQPHVDKKGEETPGRFDVCYKALLRLTIRDALGHEMCHYDGGSAATALNQTRGDAHDLAYKSALSLAKKRAAINLGDQFGLSLYNKGQMSALVMATLVGNDDAGDDVQAGVEQQVTLDEAESPAAEAVEPEDVETYLTIIGAAVNKQELMGIGQQIAKARVSDEDRVVMRKAYSDRMDILKEA